MINHKHKKKLLFISLATALYGNVTLADETNNESLDNDEVETITVTSRRKVETVLEIPMAVSTVSAAEIADRNYTDAEDIYRTLAGAAMPRNELILRGLSGGNTAAPDTTATFVDDIPWEYTKLSDIERVEVLRGPQGTLYGSNAIGGTVRIITKKPVLDEFELFGSFTAANEKDVDGYDTDASLGINIPIISDTLALRVNTNFAHDQRQYVNMNTGVHSTADDSMIRAQLLWQVDDNIGLTLGYTRTESKTLGYNQGDASTPGGYYDYDLAENPDAKYGYDVSHKWVECDPSLTRAQCMMTKPGANAPIANGDVPLRYQLWDSMDPWSNETFDLFTLNASVDDIMGFASLDYAGSYREEGYNSLSNWSRLDGNDMFRTWIINSWPEERMTHELRLQNIDMKSPLSWTVGMFYDKTEQNNVPDYQIQYHEGGGNRMAALQQYWWDWTDDPTETGQTLFNNPQMHWRNSVVYSFEREFSLFADVAYLFDLGDAGEVEINGGVRHYTIEDGFKDDQAGLWGSGSDEEGGEESGNRYKFSASYRPTDELSVYALYSEGYRPGGNNAPLEKSCADDPAAKNFKRRYTSDSINNYELGIKGAAFDRNFNYAVAVYNIDWQDMLTDVYMDTCGFSYTANGGKARSQGVEFESTAQLTDDLKMIMNASYTNSEILEDNDAISAEKGDDMTMVPDTSAYIAFDQGYQLMGKQAYVRADYTYYGEYKTHFNTKEEDEVPSYGLVNLSTRLEISDNATISIHINNLLDEDTYKYKRARSRSDRSTPQDYIEFLEGRTIAFRVDYSFF